MFRFSPSKKFEININDIISENNQKNINFEMIPEKSKKPNNKRSLYLNESQIEVSQFLVSGETPSTLGLYTYTM